MPAFYKTTALATAAILAIAGSASAGGYIAPVTPTPDVPPVAAPVANWAGAYGGVSLGYSGGGDDEVGVEVFEDGVPVGIATGLTNLKIKGVTADIHGGYRWQRGAWVFGPELALEGGSVDAEETVSGSGIAVRFKSEVNYLATLTMKTGYLMNPQTMVYGTAGVSHGDFDYTLSNRSSSASEGYTATGYVLGLGVERMMNDRMSVFAEWQYRNYGTSDVTFTEGSDSVVTVGTPEHHNVKVGVNFSF